jgi:hypothetical protein
MQLRNIDKLCIAAGFPLALFLLAIAYAPFLLGWHEAFDSHPLLTSSPGPIQTRIIDRLSSSPLLAG